MKKLLVSLFIIAAFSGWAFAAQDTPITTTTGANTETVQSESIKTPEQAVSHKATKSSKGLKKNKKKSEKDLSGK